MSTLEKRRALLAVVLAGVVLIFAVLIAAYSASVQHENNEYAKMNMELQGEIDTLQVKIKSANNIDAIEKVATNDLGMVYPTAGQCVYLTEQDKPKGDFAAIIKQKAYN